MGDRGAKALVLIIEDDGPTGSVMSEIVTDVVGVAVRIVSSPELIDASPLPDLVITDIVADDGELASGGRAYLEGLRARFSTTPLLLVTARSWARADGAEALPVDAVVVKPFDIDHLADRIRSLLATAHRTAA